MSNILIIKHGSLGDIAQASGAIQDISENHKNDQIYMLTTKAYFDLFKKNPFIYDVILDKISILEIKQEKIKDHEKLKFIKNEHAILKKQLENNVKTDQKLNDLFQSLKEINAKLWIIEDDKRQCEKEKDFGEKFIKLSRDVHFFNDNRAKIKLEINNYTGSIIKEIKEYTSY